MREQQFIRFVEEICYLLKLSQPCSKTALQYFLQFKEYQNHHFDQEILVAACIYLSVKIFQEEVRIRDILNMIYVLTSLYKLSTQQTAAQKQHQQKQLDQNKQNAQEKQDKQIQHHKPQAKQQMNNQNNMLQQSYQPKQQIIIEQNSHQNEYSQQPYILLKNIQKLQNLTQLIQPRYSLSDYNQYKGKIIQAEQMLLRILGFSFSLSEQNKKELKRLLIAIHHMRIPPTIAETIIKLYNDIHYIDIKYWPEGLIYFGYLVTKVYVKDKIESQVVVSLQLKESKSEVSQNKSSDKETAEINRIKEFITLMSQAKKWQQLLCADIKELENYAEKLTKFYSGIQVSS